MKNLMIALILMTAAHANAANQRFSCSNVGDVEEWTIYVDLEKGLAGFFDNDSTVVVPLTRSGLAESIPPQWMYVFGDSQIEIHFNKTKLKASVTMFDAGTQKEERYESLDGCRPDNSFTLDDDGLGLK